MKIQFSLFVDSSSSCKLILEGLSKKYITRFIKLNKIQQENPRIPFWRSIPPETIKTVNPPVALNTPCNIDAVMIPGTAKVILMNNGVNKEQEMHITKTPIAGLSGKL